jgi:uncharacterized radical SAM superfamily Fe-S cluster-containing enzyme
MHQMSECATCARPVEGRVVLRDGAVLTLVYCPDCGQTEHHTADDADAYVRALVDRGTVPEGHQGDWEFKRTTSTCPTCLDLIEAAVVFRDNKAYFKKDCRRCGPSEALVSEDAGYYARAYAYARAGTQPFQYGNTVSHGCPTDCGTCEDHEQHTCLPIVEVTDHCNLECPICIVNNQYSNHMEPAAFARIVDRLIASEGECESLAISGGEPTSHPQILELLAIADRPEIGRVLLITNGLRLGKDRAFAQAIKDSGAYVALQLDGFDAETHTIVRGRDLTAEKEAALTALRELDIPTQLIFVAVKGVNDHQIGQCVELLMKEDHILSINFQPVAHTGLGGGVFEHDPMDRITIPGVIERIAEQTDVLEVSDFYPLPCSHPQCVSLTYLLKLDDGSFVPFPRFVDYSRHGELLRSSATLPASSEVHDAMLDVIHDVFANADDIQRGDDILGALRSTLKTMFPSHKLSAREQVRIGEARSKSIFLHAYMDRHDFDLERLRKCCHHYPQEDGRVMPACGFNMFHRGAAQGEDTPTPEWSKRSASLRVVD